MKHLLNVNYIIASLILSGCWGESTAKVTTNYTARIRNMTSNEVTVSLEVCPSCDANAADSCKESAIPIAAQDQASVTLVTCVGTRTGHAKGTSFGKIPDVTEEVLAIPNISQSSLTQYVICAESSVIEAGTKPTTGVALTIEASDCAAGSSRMSVPIRKSPYPAKANGSP